MSPKYDRRIALRLRRFRVHFGAVFPTGFLPCLQGRIVTKIRTGNRAIFIVGFDNLRA